MNSLSRRKFLQSTAAASTGAIVTHMLPSLALGQTASFTTPASIPAWASRPMRWMQLTLVEDDPSRFSVGFWLDYFKQTRADGVCLSGGGCVAYYPTEIPYHHRSTWLGNRDVLGELVSGCRKLGLSVLTRTDPHATYDDMKSAHPDWIALDVEGKPIQHWSSPEMWVTCPFGPYSFEFMTSVHKEIMSRYKVDGLFLNRWEGGSWNCYCPHCRANFKAATGLEIPRTTSAKEPNLRAYRDWRQQRLLELLDLWNAEIRKINPESVAIPNNGSGALTRFNALETSARAPMLVADRQARHGLTPVWAIGKTAKEYRATMGDKPIVALFGVGFEDNHRWKDSVNSSAEIRIWALDAIANGMQPWCSKFSGTLHDERWLKGIEELYLWAAKQQPYLADRKPLANVALVYSQQTAWNYGGDHADTRVESFALGWYQTLIESRIPFEMVHDRLLDANHLSNFKTLILPNIAALSDAQCKQLRAFVKNGGNLICTYETSLYDELGTRRKNFALADLFGVDWTGKTESPMRNSYIRLEHEQLPHHPLFTDLEDAPRIINGISRLEVTPRKTFAETPLTLIPAYPDLPMEKVYPRTSQTDISCLYLSKPAGRVAYFPFDIDNTFWDVLDEDHLKIMRNTITWAHQEKQIVEVEGPGLLDVTVWRSPTAITIHLVNLTNPMALKGPFRRFFPVGAQTLKLQLPSNTHVKQAHLLVAEKQIPFESSGDALHLTVPSINDHEVIALEI